MRHATAIGRGFRFIQSKRFKDQNCKTPATSLDFLISRVLGQNVDGSVAIVLVRSFLGDKLASRTAQGQGFEVPPIKYAFIR